MEILVAGGSSGIGLSILKKLYENGHSLTVIARQFDDIDKQQIELKNRYFADFQYPEKIRDIFSNINEKFEALIILFGVYDFTLISKVDSISLEKVFKINVFSPALLIKFFSKSNFVKGGSSVVMISSVSSIKSSPGDLIYSSSKSALSGVVRTLSLELAKKKIRVNSISPGLINSKTSKKIKNTLGDVFFKNILDNYPLGIGDSDDIYEMIEFLISKKSSWITGQNLIMDGGFSLK